MGVEATCGDLAFCPSELLHRDRIGQNFEGLDKALPLPRRNEYAGRPPVPADFDDVAGLLDLPQKSEKRVLGLAHGHASHGMAIIVAI